MEALKARAIENEFNKLAGVSGARFLDAGTLESEDPEEAINLEERPAVRCFLDGRGPLHVLIGPTFLGYATPKQVASDSRQLLDYCREMRQRDA